MAQKPSELKRVNEHNALPGKFSFNKPIHELFDKLTCEKPSAYDAVETKTKRELFLSRYVRHEKTRKV